MERISRILSIMLVALIGCVTVFQCHHHDAVGNAFFLTIGDREVTQGLCHGDCHAGGDAPGGQDRTGDCGLHVDVAPLIEKGTVCLGIFQAIGGIPAEPGFRLEDCQVMSTLLWQIDKRVTVADGYGLAGSLRGPPCV